MLIQKELEAKVMSALSAALSAADVDCEVAGAWATANAGLVKWSENTDSAALLNVAVASPTWETFSTPLVNFAVNLTLFVRPELDPQGTLFASIAEVIETQLRIWMTSTYQQSFTALDLTTLSIDSISLGGGDSPTIDKGVTTTSWTFTLSGSYRAASSTT